MTDQAASTQINTPYVVLIACVAAIGGFLFGFDTAVINGAVNAIQADFQTTDWLTGFAVSLALLGSAIGAFFAGPIADHLGRTRCMMIAAIMFFVSAIGSGAPVTIWDFIFWRMLGGMAVGGASVIVPAYIAEISPASMRGRLGSLQQLAIVVGIFIALLSDFGIAWAAGGSAENEFWFGFKAWQWMFWAEAIPAVVYGIGALIIDESPRHLVAQQRHDMARHVMAKVFGAVPEGKIEQIQQSLETHRKRSLRDIVSGRFGFLPIVWIGIILSLFQQFVGINVIFYYSTMLWRSVGFDEKDALMITVIGGITNIITTLIAIAFVDRLGRKPLLLVGSIGMALTLGTMAVCFSLATYNDQGQPTLPGGIGITALIAANAYIFCFGFSWGPVVWVLLGEMFNNRIRGKALAIAAAAQWIANFAVSTTFPPMAGNLGLGITYSVYTVMAVASFFFVLTMVRETRGMELEAMQQTP